MKNLGFEHIAHSFECSNVFISDFFPYFSYMNIDGSFNDIDIGTPDFL